MKDQLLERDEAAKVARRLLVNASADQPEMQIALRFAEDDDLTKPLRDLKSLCDLLIKSINNMKQKPIKITDDLARTMLWMSIRYSVGGHTIATCTHASDLAGFLRDNPQLIDTEDKRLFYALDIRREISTKLHFRGNVSVDGYNNHIDALSLILHKMVEDGITEFNDYRWDVDLINRKVECRPIAEDEERPLSGRRVDFSDFMPWIKLAGWLDPTEEITVEYEGKTTTHEGFAYYTFIGTNFRELHCTAEGYIGNPFVDSFVSYQYIKQIKQLH